MVKVFRKKAFRTVEGAIIGTNLDKMWAHCRNVDEVRSFFDFTGHTYSITEAMKVPNEKSVGLKTERQVLYLGVDAQPFANDG